MMGHALNQSKWSWHHIHLPVSNQNISITAKPLDALVLMFVFVVSIEKISVTNHQVEYRVAEAIRFLWVAPENVINGWTVVQTCRSLTVAVEICLSSRVSQGFQFISLGNRYDSKIGVAVAAPDFEVQAGGFQSRLEPVLKMILLV